MNVLEATITKIIGEPYLSRNKEYWLLDVEIECWGQISISKLQNNNKAELLKYKAGDVIYT